MMDSPAELLERARQIWTEPSRRTHLDWYDGPIQSLLQHPEHGSWYVFAVQIGAAGERQYAMLQLLDPNLFEVLNDLETREEADRLARLGREVLLPATAENGWWLLTRDGLVHEVRPMTLEERATVTPVGLRQLMNA